LVARRQTGVVKDAAGGKHRKKRTQPGWSKGRMKNARVQGTETEKPEHGGERVEQRVGEKKGTNRGPGGGTKIGSRLRGKEFEKEDGPDAKKKKEIVANGNTGETQRKVKGGGGAKKNKKTQKYEGVRKTEVGGQKSLQRKKPGGTGYGVRNEGFRGKKG